MSEWVSLVTSWHVFITKTQHELQERVSTVGCVERERVLKVGCCYPSSTKRRLQCVFVLFCFFPSLRLSKYTSVLSSQFTGTSVMTWMLFHESSLLLKKSLLLSQLWDYKIQHKDVSPWQRFCLQNQVIVLFTYLTLLITLICAVKIFLSIC